MLFSIFLAYLVVEIVHYLHGRFQAWSLRNSRRYILRNEPEIVTAVSKWAYDANVSMVELIQGCFQGRTRIPVGNVKEFMQWMMYADGPASESAVVDAMDGLALDFPPGYNPAIQHNCHPLRSLEYSWQPWILGRIYAGLNTITHRSLESMGFDKTGRFWHRGGSSHCVNIFFHGISPGIAPYWRLIDGFSWDTIIVEMPQYQIGSGNFNDYNEASIVEEIHTTVRNLGYTQVNIIGHSFGTMMAAWCVKRYPSEVKNLILLDPVSLLLFLPTVSYSFLHSKPSTLAEMIVRYFAARDLTIAYNITRNFNWRECNLLPADIPLETKLTIGLSRDDTLIPAEAILRSFSKARILEYTGPHFLHVATSRELPMQIREILDA